MKEFTVTMNAQITLVLDEADGYTEEILRALTPAIHAGAIGETLGANVTVSNLKLFVGNKREDEETADPENES